jgi:hypothetical protein
MKTENSFTMSKILSFMRVLASAALLTVIGAQKLLAHDQNLPWYFESVTTVASEQIDPADSTHTIEIDVGTGHSTRLGAVTIVIVADDYFVIDPVVGPALAITGQAILTASNGDTLTFNIDTLIPYNPPTFPFRAELTITGGTGKLAGASGAGDGDGYVDADGALHFESAGTLTVVNPGK